jgi:hypothetical protein
MLMLARIHSKLTFSNTISLIALFVALSGTAYAAVTLPRNSVGARQIKKNAVRASEVRANAVAGAEVKDGAIGLVDLAANSVDASKVVDGSLGGADVAPGALLGGKVTVQYEQATVALADNTSSSYNVHCPAGQTAVAGGARGDATDSEFTNVTSSRPIISTTNSGAPVDGGTFTGWRTTVLNPTGGAPPGGDILPEVWVICAAL